MNQDQRHRLALAFGHLNKFSVPGVGTFRKERVAAKVDVAHGHLLPPADLFLLEPGEHYISSLTEFLFRHLQVNHGAAEAMVRELGSALRTEVEETGKVDIPGVGVLTRDRLYGFQLEASNLQVPELFGLGEIAYTPPRSAARTATAAEKQRVIHEQIESNTVRVEPAPPPAGRRQSPVKWIALLLLVGMVVAGIGFWPQIREQMVSMGWMEDGKPLADAKPVQADEPAEVDEAGSNPDAQGLGDEAATLRDTVESSPVADTLPTTEKIATTVTPDAKTSDETLSAKGGAAVAPVKGVHYLVVASTRSEKSAMRVAKRLNAKKYKVKVIRPGKRGYYRVTIFSSKDKAEVIRKMVEWKNDFPHKTYIYTH